MDDFLPDYINKELIYQSKNLLSDGSPRSQVYRADSVEFPGMKMLIKRLRKKTGHSSYRLRAEARILMELHHHALPEIRGIIDDDSNYLYIIRRYIYGKTLLEHCGGKPLPEREVFGYFRQLCEVFNYLHTRKNKIIYQDCKPANIILQDESEHIYLIDFDVANDDLNAGSRGGTKDFAAPEQFDRGRKTDERTDIYNLGATIYYLLTYSSPNRHKDLNPVRLRVKNPKISAGMDAVVMKCLERKPERRYQSMTEILEALDYIKTLSISAPVKRIISFCSTLLFLFIFLLGMRLYTVDKENRYSNQLIQASAFADNGQPLDAIAAYEESIRLYPERPEGYAELGVLYMRQYGEQACADLLQKASNTYSTLIEDARYNFVLGSAYYNTGDDKNAKTFFEKAVHIDNSNIMYKRFLASVYLRLGLDEEGRRVLSEMPESDASRAFIAAQISEQNGDWEKALNEYGQCLNAQDTDLRVRACLLSVSIYENHFTGQDTLDKRIALLENAEGVNHYLYEPAILERLGICCLEKADKETQPAAEESLRGALQYFQSAEAIRPGNLRNYVNISISYQKLGDYQNCAKVLDQAIKRYPRNAELLYRRTLAELDKQNSYPLEERGYLIFADYAYKAKEAVPEENENTRHLNQLLESYGFPLTRPEGDA